MKRFKFPLQKVLDYRRQAEDGMLRSFGEAVKVFQRRREDLERVAAELATYRNRMAAMGVGKLATRDLALYRSYLSHCEVRLAGAAEEMREAALEMETRRRRLVQARREKRVIERLKEIKRRQYDYEAAREETKELDEIATKKFFAERTGAGEGVAHGAAARVEGEA